LGARSLRALLASHGIRPRKELGQNFVVDPNTVRKVVAVSGVGPQDDVLEIGAGVGSLTLGLAAAARHVIALETDQALVAILREVLAGAENVDIVQADATRADLAALPATRVVANLPYNIAASIVLRVLEDAPKIEELTVMVQKEVGERLAAEPGSRTYGTTSLLLAYWAAASVAARVGRGAFFPAPDVDSVLVRAVRRVPPEADYTRFKELVRTAFSQRRKTLRNSLAPAFGSTVAAEGALLAAGLDPGHRAEDVGLGGFLDLVSGLR
jgi:16S rRNA (adenine1518-N6/adenine1519-N6)-dimethyltransferase